ncbi:MAG TPA: ATP-binding protein [Thermoanaerobaculia bacterium]|nr:ATP-binding protein [Thermoanaerobaculia bacterium]
MSQVVLANYDSERQLFAELLVPSSPKRILLFQGESGIGKSTLLRSCAELIPASAKFIPIELRGAAVSISEIFYRFAGRLDWTQLENFCHQLVAMEPAVATTLDRNHLTGIRNQINITLSSQGLIDRSERIAALTEALFRDLESLHNLVVLTFDTFDNASTEASEWLSGPLLERMARTKNARVVIAGKTVPNINNIEWGAFCEIRMLSGIVAADPWLAIIEKLRKIIPHHSGGGWMSGVCDALNGNPAKIMQVIEGLPTREQ